MKRLILPALLISLIFNVACSCEPEPSGNTDKDAIQLPDPEGTWLLNSLEDIDQYASSKEANTKTIRLLRNENENIQLVISTENNAELEIIREGTPSAIAFDCRKVADFGVIKNDVLVPCNGKVKPEKKLVKVWLSFKAAADAPADTYKEIIRFKSAEKEYLVAIYVKVEDAALPLTPTHPCVFGINPDNFIFTGLTAEQKYAKRREVSDLLLDYRVSPYFSSWLSGTMKTECFSSPYPINDKRTIQYLKDPRFARIALPYHALDDATLQSMLTTAQEEGLLDKAYFYIWDEPTLPSEYEQIHGMADRLHKYAPSAKILTSFYCGPKEGDRKDDLFAVFDMLNGATSIYCTGVWSLQGNENRSAQCKAKVREGQEWWNYVCMGDSPGLANNSTGIPNRVVMWRNWKEQPSGFLYWVVNAFSTMNPLSQRPDLPVGDGILVYPGEAYGVDVPCVSIRLERWRDGAEDYEMLVMYEKAKGRAAAENLLANVYKSPTNYTKEVKYVEALKKNLIEGIVK